MSSDPRVSGWPDPRQAQTARQFMQALDQLRCAADLTYRDLVDRANSHGGLYMQSVSTVHEKIKKTLTGAEHPTKLLDRRLTESIVHLCYCVPGVSACPPPEVQQWMQRWRQLQTQQAVISGPATPPSPALEPALGAPTTQDGLPEQPAAEPRPTDKAPPPPALTAINKSVDAVTQPAAAAPPAVITHPRRLAARLTNRSARLAIAAMAVVLASLSAWSIARDADSPRTVTRQNPPPGTAPAHPGGDYRPCGADTSGDDIINANLFIDDNATRINPTLDFDSMNGSARFHQRNGRVYYWGRAGSDDSQPRSGGARLRWSTPSTGWHDCSVALPIEERGYVRTPAVATVIAGQPVTLQVCLYRDTPPRENCTAVLP